MSTEDKDSLRSTSFARIIDLVSEGEIVGLVDGARSIYLDDTPLQNKDGSFNFSGVKWDQRVGTPSQAEFAGFPSVEHAVAVGVRCRENIPVVRTITDSTVDAVNVILSVPSLLRTDKDTGDISGTEVRLLVEVQPNGGAWQAFGSSSTPTAMQATSSTTATMPAGSTTTRADMSISITGAQVASYLVEYRSAGSAAAWATFASGSVTGFQVGYSETDGPVYEASVTTSRNDLVQGRYEFRLTNTSGTGTLALAGTYYAVQQVVRISGKTSSKYQRQVQCRLPAGGAPWNVRVTRLSEDSTSTYLQNDIYWDSYIEVTEDKLRMPHSAGVAMTIDAQAFGSSIPARAYDMKLLKVKIPSNHNPLTRAYTGSWDGTFVKAWTNNPAWVFYDLLTHPRYGLGAFVGTGVDKWSLYQIGRYCDELVPDGFGGTEPRFTANAYLATKQDAYKLVNDLASVFRGLVYWSSGSIASVQDAPSDPVALFTPANVIDGEFNYQGSSAKARHTAALVTWNDPTDMYRQKTEYVEDADGIARYGLIITEVAAFACTSRGQAARVGRWLLYSELRQTETVAFKTALEGLRCRPGQVIKIIDTVRAGVRLGGRLLAATTSTFTLDTPVTLAPGQTYTLTTMKADGTLQDGTVTTGSGVTSAITVSPAYSQAPQAGSIWVLASSAVQPQLFQVLTVTEAEGIYEVAAISHDPSKYAAIENGLTLQPRSISVLSQRPASPTNIVVTEVLYARGQTLASRLDVSWTPPTGATAYAMSWVRGDGAYSPEQTTSVPSLEILGAQDGQAYTITVYALNPLGGRSALPAKVDYVVIGKTAAPSDVSGFTGTRADDKVAFAWRPVSDVDLDFYEIRLGINWASGSLVGRTIDNSLETSAPRGGTFLIRARDTSGNYSLNDGLVTLPDLSGINVVIDRSELAAGWTGSASGAFRLDLKNTSDWSGTTSWSDGSTWDYWLLKSGITIGSGQRWSDLTASWSSYTGAWLWSDSVQQSNYATWAAMSSPWSSYATTWASPVGIDGTYTSAEIDIGYETGALLTLVPTLELLRNNTLPWSAYTGTWASYSAPNWTWQGLISGISASYEVRTRTATGAYTDWAPLTSGAYQMRYAQVRVTLHTDDSTVRPYLTDLRMLFDVPDRVLHLSNVAIPAAGATINWPTPFVGIDTVQVTLQSGAIGDTARVTAKSTTSVTINLYNSVGTAKAGTVDIDAYGYGEVR